ncbi:MAG: MBL fold metallo-hydrolase [candidate division NC10 bacterium]|nr:MBL fold metallo-hydrolase [candidate division NC10 bacterium]
MITNLEKVYKIALPTPFPVGPVNIYLLKGRGLTLIDSGPNTEEAWEALVKGFDRIGASMKDLHRVIITHGHSDHYGLAARIASKSGAEVWAHAADQKMVEDHPRELLRWVEFLRDFLPATGLAQPVVQGICDYIAARTGFAKAAPVSQALRGGECLVLDGFTLEVIHSPGHTPGSICLFEPSLRVLFSGDHLLKEITPNPVLQAFPDFFGERFQGLIHYRESLSRLQGLPAKLVLPGHGEEFQDLKGRIQEIDRHVNERKGRFLALLGKGEVTPLQAAEGLFPDLPRSQILLAIFEVIGHLDLLREEGLVEVVEKEGLLLVNLLQNHRHLAERI